MILISVSVCQCFRGIRLSEVSLGNVLSRASALAETMPYAATSRSFEQHRWMRKEASIYFQLVY